MTKDSKQSLGGINNYGRHLSATDIEQKLYRDFVGGMWKEIGELQYQFLKTNGLEPHHKLADIGCGCLRGGLWQIRYFDPSNYYGLDINASLIEAGKIEIEAGNLVEKSPTLLVNDEFKVSKFNILFDYIISVSLFTHLPMNMIIRCLTEVKNSLKADGKYFSTFCMADKSANIEQIVQEPGGKIPNYDSDPCHYSKEEIEIMGRLAGLNVEIIGNWKHPRNQKMVEFTL